MRLSTSSPSNSCMNAAACRSSKATPPARAAAQVVRPRDNRRSPACARADANTTCGDTERPGRHARNVVLYIARNVYLRHRPERSLGYDPARARRSSWLGYFMCLLGDIGEAFQVTGAEGALLAQPARSSSSSSAQASRAPHRQFRPRAPPTELRSPSPAEQRRRGQRTRRPARVGPPWPFARLPGAPLHHADFRLLKDMRDRAACAGLEVTTSRERRRRTARIVVTRGGAASGQPGPTRNRQGAAHADPASPAGGPAEIAHGSRAAGGQPNMALEHSGP